MLRIEQQKVVDKAWDIIWSNGITNPISVVDVMATVLIGHSIDGVFLDRVVSSLARCDTDAVAAQVRDTRRQVGISAGSEVESPEFWTNASVLVPAFEALTGLVGDRGDLLGDVFEHVLSHLSIAGQFGQFRTPHHIVEFLIQLLDPQPGEHVLDPACGTGGFLIAAEAHRAGDGKSGLIEGFEIDRTVARLAQANMALHGVKSGRILNVDGLVFDGADRPDVILANPPFAGQLGDHVSRTVGLNSSKTELLFVASMICRLRGGGRAAVIVPFGVLTSNGKAAQNLRQQLILDNYLEAVFELPQNVFAPYTGVKTGILVWKNEDNRGRPTRLIRISNDGYSLDSKRVALESTDLPDALQAFREGGGETSVDLSISALRESDFNLNPSRYLPPSPNATNEAEKLSANDAIIELREVASEITLRLNRMGELV